MYTAHKARHMVMEPTAAPQQALNPQKLLDEVIYLASLASDKRVIDPVLDNVRSITANLQVGKSFTDHDRTILIDVRIQLTEHLVHDDKLRSFTKEELSEQVAQALGPRSQHESLWSVMKIIGATVAAYVIGMLVMYTAHVSNPFLIAGTFAIAALYVGLIWLYLSALGTFTQQLKQAYQWICLNMMGLCVAAICGTTVAALPQLAQNPLLSYGWLVPYASLAATAIGFEGMRRLARAVELRAFVASWRVALLGGIVLAVLANFVPQVVAPNKVAQHVGLLTWVMAGYFCVLIAVVGFTVARQVTARYARAIGWFSASYVVAAVVCAGTIATIMSTGPIAANTMSIINTAFGTCGVPLIIAGYMFSRSVGKS